MSNVFSIDRFNGEPICQVSALDHHPRPGFVTLNYRELDAHALLMPDGGSDWRTLTVGEVLTMLAAGDARAAWLREYTSIDLAAPALTCPTDLSAPAQLPRRDHAPTWRHPHPVDAGKKMGTP